MTSRRRTLVIALVVLLVLGVLRVRSGGSSGYHVTAYFREAVALYPHSKVHVMGVNAGSVDKVTVERGRVRVDMTVDRDVPLPAEVTATINALTVIGERNVVLGPAWHPGQPRLRDGATIPQDHTITPIEPDEALEAFRDLAKAIDPSVVADLVHNGANVFSGHEASFNGLIDTASGLTADLASQDGRIIKAAQNLHELATIANSRQDQLGHVVDGFAEASGLLAGERKEIAGILSGAARLVDDGTSLLDAYGGTLPGDLANLSRLGLTLQANEKVFSDLFASFPRVGQGLIDAYDVQNNTVHLGANLGPSVDRILDATIGRLLDSLGLGDLEPCIRIPSPC